MGRKTKKWDYRDGYETYTLEWGDGTHVPLQRPDGTMSHTFTEPGTYEMRINPGGQVVAVRIEVH